MGVSTPILRKENKIRTKKMEKAQKTTIKKWIMCLTISGKCCSIATELRKTIL